MLYYVSLRLSVLCNALLRSTVLYLDALRCAALCCAVLCWAPRFLCYAMPCQERLCSTLLDVLDRTVHTLQCYTV